MSFTDGWRADNIDMCRSGSMYGMKPMTDVHDISWTRGQESGWWSDIEPKGPLSDPGSTACPTPYFDNHILDSINAGLKTLQIHQIWIHAELLTDSFMMSKALRCQRPWATCYSVFVLGPARIALATSVSTLQPIGQDEPLPGVVVLSVERMGQPPKPKLDCSLFGFPLSFPILLFSLLHTYHKPSTTPAFHVDSLFENNRQRSVQRLKADRHVSLSPLTPSLIPRGIFKTVVLSSLFS